MKIKISLFFVIFSMALSMRAFSQANFTEGTNMINFGIGFGNVYYTGFGTGYDFGYSPALTLSVDHSLKKFDEIYGTIGVGGIIGFQSSSTQYNSGPNFYKYHWTNIIIASRGTYHAGFINTDKFDVYGGLMLGVRIEAVDYTTNYGAPDTGDYGGVHLTGGVFVGGAWYFVPNVGAFAELGYDVSYFKVGICLKAGGGNK